MKVILMIRVLFLRKHFIPYYKEHIDESAETPNDDDMISAFPMQIFPVPGTSSSLTFYSYFKNADLF